VTWLIVLVSALFGPTLIAALSRKRGHRLGWHLGAVVAIAALTALVAAGTQFLSVEEQAFVRIHAPGWLTLPIALGLVAIFVILGSVMVRLASVFGGSGFADGQASLQRLPTWAVGLAILICAPCEEYLYRVIGLGLLGPQTGTAIAIMLLAGAFALAHLPLWGLGAALVIGASGALLTLVYAINGDFFANVIAHVAVDWIGLVVSRRIHQPQDGRVDREPP
jgi:membrane protease YdiL (CAAX protease family)